MWEDEEEMRPSASYSNVDTSLCEEMQRINKVKGKLDHITTEMKPILDYRLSYAKDMAAIAERRRRSGRVSVTSDALFATNGVCRLAADRKEHEERISTVEKRCYLILCEIAVSEVEKVVACQSISQTWPQVKLNNRYATTKHVHEEGEAAKEVAGCMAAFSASK